MNSNLVHNIINVIIAITAILSLPEVHQFLPPELSVKIIGVLGVVKLVINTVRDGVSGLVKEQPPVK